MQSGWLLLNTRTPTASATLKVCWLASPAATCARLKSSCTKKNRQPCLSHRQQHYQALPAASLRPGSSGVPPVPRARPSHQTPPPHPPPRPPPAAHADAAGSNITPRQQQTAHISADMARIECYTHIGSCAVTDRFDAAMPLSCTPHWCD